MGAPQALDPVLENGEVTGQFIHLPIKEELGPPFPLSSISRQGSRAQLDKGPPHVQPTPT